MSQYRQSRIFDVLWCLGIIRVCDTKSASSNPTKTEPTLHFNNWLVLVTFPFLFETLKRSPNITHPNLHLIMQSNGKTGQKRFSDQYYYIYLPRPRLMLV